MDKGYRIREEYAMDVQANFFRTYVRNTNAANTTLSSTLAVNGSWQHVAGVYDGTGKSLKIYTNGQLSASTAGSGNNLLSLMTTNNHEISIGCRQSVSTGGPYNLPLTGTIDEVRLYNRAL